MSRTSLTVYCITTYVYILPTSIGLLQYLIMLDVHITNLHVSERNWIQIQIALDKQTRLNHGTYIRL